MSVVAILLAAGEGRRMGLPKALLTIEGSTFLARVALVLARPGVASVVAVLGHQASRVAAEASLPSSVAVVENPRWADGMLTSVHRGLDEAETRGADAVLLHPVDHPLVDPATVDRVLEALSAGAVVAVPSYQNRRGHPGGFAAAAWPALRAASPERGARAVLADHPDWVVHVPGDPGCLTGINTPEQYARAVEGRSGPRKDPRPR